MGASNLCGSEHPLCLCGFEFLKESRSLGPSCQESYNDSVVITATAFYFVHILATQHKPSQSGDGASVRKFVQGFYDWYVPRALKGDAETLALKTKPALFSPEIRKGLEEDRRAAEKNPDEIVGLDFDPFLNSQDLADTYTVKKVEQKGSRWFASVYGHYKGQKEDSAASVVAQVEKTKTGWRFTNFLYGKDDDLLKTLKQLKKDREKK